MGGIGGVTRKTQGSYEAQGNPDAEYLNKIRKAGADTHYILTGERIKEVREQAFATETIRLSREDTDGFVSVPRYDIQVSAGGGTFEQSEQIVDYFKFKKSWLSKRGLDPMHLTMVEVTGDSMEPLLTSGDVVLVDHSDTKLKTGQAYVLRIYHELLVKYIDLVHYAQENKMKIKVRSVNPAYEPWTVDTWLFDGAEDHIKIIGRVVASSHNW